MLSVQTPAKVNLFLNIRPRRPDGYHEISSVMQAVRLCDQLDISPRKDGKPGLLFTCNVPQFEQDAENNLVVKAYRLFWRETGLPPLGLHVHLTKEIPAQAGLGGGSSDAAAMLVVLNHLAHAGLSEEQLRTLGAKLGSDVPFFIAGGSALVSGRGEIVQPLPASLIPELDLVIIKPLQLPIDTALAYHRYAAYDRYEIHSPDHLLSALKTLKQKRRIRDGLPLESYLLNDFEKVLFPEYPLLGDMARRMREAGIQRPLLSGSGSAMIGFVEPGPEIRQRVSSLFPKSHYEIHWTETWSGGLMQVDASSGKAVLPEPVLA
jgi:4-diphosphocytidyl-2-C-methyl-D-erythritol kinase